MKPLNRWVATHSALLFCGLVTMLTLWSLLRANTSISLWFASIVALALLWSLPFRFRRKPSPFASPQQLRQQLGAGRITLLHFYSDF